MGSSSPNRGENTNIWVATTQEFLSTGKPIKIPRNFEFESQVENEPNTAPKTKMEPNKW